MGGRAPWSAPPRPPTAGQRDGRPAPAAASNAAVWVDGNCASADGSRTGNTSTSVPRAGDRPPSAARTAAPAHEALGRGGGAPPDSMRRAVGGGGPPLSPSSPPWRPSASPLAHERLGRGGSDGGGAGAHTSSDPWPGAAGSGWSAADGPAHEWLSRTGGGLPKGCGPHDSAGVDTSASPDSMLLLLPRTGGGSRLPPPLPPPPPHRSPLPQPLPRPSPLPPLLPNRSLLAALTHRTRAKELSLSGSLRLDDNAPDSREKGALGVARGETERWTSAAAVDDRGRGEPPAGARGEPPP